MYVLATLPQSIKDLSIANNPVKVEKTTTTTMYIFQLTSSKCRNQIKGSASRGIQSQLVIRRCCM